MKISLASALVVTAMVMAVPALAQEAQVEGAVDIESNEMEILENNKTAIFRGDVIAKRPNDTIRCQEMLVTYKDVQKQNGSTSTEVEKIDCTGAVSIKTSTQDITGNKALFLLLKDELTVTGNVTVVQDKTVLKGPQLFVNLKTRTTRMSGGRVKGRFTPK
jgi:lipopolysaccharide export system protein LptA